MSNFKLNKNKQGGKIKKVEPPGLQRRRQHVTAADVVRNAREQNTADFLESITEQDLIKFRNSLLGGVEKNNAASMTLFHKMVYGDKIEIDSKVTDVAAILRELRAERGESVVSFEDEADTDHGMGQVVEGEVRDADSP